jgi:hypothetical protein
MDPIAFHQRIKDLKAEAFALHSTSDESGARIAKCARVSAVVIEKEKELPDWYLAQQWHGVMSHLPLCANDYGEAITALRCLKSIAICMRATQFTEADTFFSVADELETSVSRLYEIDAELASLLNMLIQPGETLQ